MEKICKEETTEDLAEEVHKFFKDRGMEFKIDISMIPFDELIKDSQKMMNILGEEMGYLDGFCRILQVYKCLAEEGRTKN